MSAGLIRILADLGLSSASQRSFFDYTDEQAAERRSSLATTFVVTMTLACMLAVLTVALRVQVTDLLFGDIGERRRSLSGWRLSSSPRNSASSPAKSYGCISGRAHTS